MKKLKIFYILYIIFVVICMIWNAKNVVEMGSMIHEENRRQKAKEQAVKDLEELAKESNED